LKGGNEKGTRGSFGSKNQAPTLEGKGIDDKENFANIGAKVASRFRQEHGQGCELPKLGVGLARRRQSAPMQSFSNHRLSSEQALIAKRLLKPSAQLNPFNERGW
jgi:hypothetical protein